MSDLQKLKELASCADEGYSGTHPRDSNKWAANEAFCYAATPAVVLALIEVAEKAQAHMTAADACDAAAALTSWSDLRAALVHIKEM